MTRDDLYAAAFRYKKAGLWKKLWDSEMFAVRLADGEFGYISIMGQAGDYCAMGLYIGDEGFESYRIIANTDVRYMDEFEQHEFLLQQKCLQAALENKDELMPEEVDEAREYAKANGIRISGKNAFPQFIKYEPGYHPWKVIEIADVDALCQALEVCTLLAEELKTASAEDFGIVDINSYTTHIPILKVETGKLQHDGYAPLPPETEKHYKTVPFNNDIGTASVKKLTKAKTWDAEVIRLLAPVQDGTDNAPYYPLLLLVAESKEGYILPESIIAKDERHMEGMLNKLAQALVDMGSAPRELRCRDSRTHALLTDFCERTGIRLKFFNGKMKMLDEAKNTFLEHMSEDSIPDELTQMAEELLRLPDDAVRMLPEEILDEFRCMLDEHVFPDELAELLEAKLRS